MMEMNVAAIAAMDASSVGGLAKTAEPQIGFAQVIERGLADLNVSALTAEGALRDLAAGKPVELHEVMISLEKARISVQTFIQIRNKLVESYQDLMRMQM
jgi:flagellar hook-basal body complex protein FliE